MKTISACLTLFILVCIPPVISAADEEEVSPVVVDAIAANYLNTKFKTAVESVRSRVSTQLLDADENVIHEDVRWERREYDSDGSYTVFITDESGKDLPDPEPGHSDAGGSKKNGDEKEEMTDAASKISPLAPFLEENRGNQRFIQLASSEPNQMVIKTKTIDAEIGGFDGTYIFDTTTWLPIRVTGCPVPYPPKKPGGKIKGMKTEFLFDILYEPYGDGFALPKTVNIQNTAKLLFLKMRFRTTTDIFDMVPRATGDPKS